MTLILIAAGVLLILTVVGWVSFSRTGGDRATATLEIREIVNDLRTLSRNVQDLLVRLRTWWNSDAGARQDEQDDASPITDGAARVSRARRDPV